MFLFNIQSSLTWNSALKKLCCLIKWEAYAEALSVSGLCPAQSLAFKAKELRFSLNRPQHFHSPGFVTWPLADSRRDLMMAFLKSLFPPAASQA